MVKTDSITIFKILQMRQEKSPTEFDAGGLGFSQNTIILMLVENLIN
jgi:hypothetical protein